jgi:hypothetical protein
MRNSLALLGIPDLPIRAFLHVGDRKIQPQGGGGGIINEIIEAPSNLVSSVSDAAADLDDTVNQEIPGGWATVASVAVPVAAPYIQAAQAAVALDKGASLEDVATNYAISQVAGQVGGAVGAETGSSLAGNVAGSTTSGLLSGATPEQALAGGLTSGAISQVTPSGLFTTPTTTPTSTPTQDYVPELNIGQGTTGATNMADITDYFNTGESVSGNYGDPNALQNSFYGYGGLGTEDPTTGFGSTPMTQAQIDATMQTFGGTSTLDTATQALVKQLLAAGGTAARGALNFLGQNGVIQGGLGAIGSLRQIEADKQAAIRAQENLAKATQQAVAGSQFRPVGVTTRFGTSQFQVDPTTGQLTSAGYTATPEITSAQNRLMGLGASYLAQTPEEVAQQYMAKQYDLLDPSRQRQLAAIRNQQFQTGRGGLSVGSTGLRPSGAQGLMGANPELEAYYNALAQQDAQLAAQAQQAGQQQVGFGAGLFGQAGQLENLAQQPFSLSQGLAQQSSLSGYRAGDLGYRGALAGGVIGRSASATVNPYARALTGLADPSSLFGNALGSYLTSSLANTSGGAGGGITSAGMQNPTLDVYGSGYVPLGYANF